MTDQETRLQCQPDQLWYPGLHLDDEYPILTSQELEALWVEYDPDASPQALHEVYGVFTTPHKNVKAIASIDLCEVVRDTAVGLDSVTGLTLGRRSAYYPKTWFDRSVTGSDYEASVIISAVRALMHAGLVQPVEHIGAIRSILCNWRAQGVYCIANTSTLPGCESGTIIHTLGRDLRGGFDALVLPRNYDGTGTITKARALEMVSEQAGLALDSVPFVHIDDAPHHVEGFLNHYTTNERLRLFSPKNATNDAINADLLCESPLDSFLKANAYFRQLGITQ
jgi:hypothetical protein